MVLLLAQLPGGEQYYTATIPEAPTRASGTNISSRGS
ncbi:hypothetical protein PENANT_c039G08085 [Penicillium antarcticum]|uniref:Uncharacterized protein n=1 Tax=Penicillium antarcticum TaxID=416450 RepID=A0A1V6PUH8_9EURO|nr:hypothetical protein PENANT_c039G08085 [Penicillium antarcticum]